MNRNRLELVTILFLQINVVAAAYVLPSLALGNPVDFTWVSIGTVALFLFSVFHAGLTLGLRHMLAFLAIAVSISLLFELVGTARGWIFGTYYYTDALGLKVAGLVPVLIPLAWFMMMYASYAMANLLVLGRCGGRSGPGLPVARRIAPARFLWLVVLSVIIMTSWDLANDPLGVASGEWVWAQKGPYFGIPLNNYLGWLVTCLLVFSCYRLYERHRPPPVIPALRSYFWWLPVAAYAITMMACVGALVALGQPEPAMVSLVVMGAFVLAAVAKSG